jgi:hypothetical protein
MNEHSLLDEHTMMLTSKQMESIDAQNAVDNEVEDQDLRVPCTLLTDNVDQVLDSNL